MGRALGEFEQVLLFALVALDDEAHGNAVREFVEQETGRARSPGSIHLTLERLERRGCVSSRLGDPTPIRGGRRKRFYSLTPAGARALKTSYELLATMARGRLGRLDELASQ